MTVLAKLLNGLGVGMVVAVFGALGVGFYGDMDDRGWIPHQAEVELYMSSNWLEGESRPCVANMKTLNESPPYVLKTLTCPGWSDAIDSHTLAIRFWGEVKRNKPNVTSYPADKLQGATDWRCVRKADEFTCYAVD